jgi:hypothetical protein
MDSELNEELNEECNEERNEERNEEHAFDSDAEDDIDDIEDDVNEADPQARKKIEELLLTALKNMVRMNACVWFHLPDLAGLEDIQWLLTRNALISYNIGQLIETQFATR